MIHEFQFINETSSSSSPFVGLSCSRDIIMSLTHKITPFLASTFRLNKKFICFWVQQSDWITPACLSDFHTSSLLRCASLSNQRSSNISWQIFQQPVTWLESEAKTLSISQHATVNAFSNSNKHTSAFRIHIQVSFDTIFMLKIMCTCSYFCQKPCCHSTLVFRMTITRDQGDFLGPVVPNTG